MSTFFNRLDFNGISENPVGRPTGLHGYSFGSLGWLSNGDVAVSSKRIPRRKFGVVVMSEWSPLSENDFMGNGFHGIADEHDPNLATKSV